MSYVLCHMSYVKCPVLCHVMSYVMPNVKCPMSYVMSYAMPYVKCPMSYVMSCPMSCPMLNVLCHVICPMSNVLSCHMNMTCRMSCPMLNVLCHVVNMTCHMSYVMSYVICPMSYVLCHMSYVKCLMSNVLCHVIWTYVLAYEQTIVAGTSTWQQEVCTQSVNPVLLPAVFSRENELIRATGLTPYSFHCDLTSNESTPSFHC